ncbi:hypothetical protein [uncultured Roseobacter sp.]|uniref:hypothetical protein n=1 Tax=uncultured Roseobacter sp. TaxID=114847 RepID=UPI00261073CB|nr:hypothetical protein [uncultured Roseobacter sp.]
MRVLALLILPLSLAGCVQFPEIDDATGQVAEQADYPDLVPLEPVLGALPTTTGDSDETQAQLEARVSGLKARANGLRGPVLSDGDRARLEEDLQ